MKQTIAVLLLISSAFGASVVTANRDIQRTGSNTSETILTPGAVTEGRVVKLGACTTDGLTYGQALLLPSVTYSGTAYQTAYVATNHGTLYAMSVGTSGCTTLWTLHLSDPIVGGGLAGNDYYGAEVGCAPTPTIDESALVAYAVCANSGTGDSASWTIYKVNITTGTLITSSVITGEYTGTGKTNCTGISALGSCVVDSIVGGKVQFQAKLHQPRAGLLSLAGSIFSAFASWNDYFVFHGWAFGHSTSTLAAAGVYNTSANSCGAAIWQSGGGIASDGTNMYVLTGNSSISSSDCASGLSESVIKLDSSLNVLGSWTTADQTARDSGDADLSSGRCIVAVSNTKILCGGKAHDAVTGKVFVLNTSNMTLAQTLDLGVIKSNFNGMTIDGNNNLFIAGRADKIYRFPYSGGGVWATSPDVSSATYISPGAFLFSSSSGTANGIIWANTPDVSEASAVQDHTLRALNPADLTQYASWALTPGKGVKFVPPTVANGLVLVPTDRNLTVFGDPNPAIPATKFVTSQ